MSLCDSVLLLAHLLVGGLVGDADPDAPDDATVAGEGRRFGRMREVRTVPARAADQDDGRNVVWRSAPGEVRHRSVDGETRCSRRRRRASAGFFFPAPRGGERPEHLMGVSVREGGGGGGVGGRGRWQRSRFLMMGRRTLRKIRADMRADHQQLQKTPASERVMATMVDDLLHC